MNPLILVGSALIGLGVISGLKKDSNKKLDSNAKPVPDLKPESQPETEITTSDNSESNLLNEANANVKESDINDDCN
jgi:hypothetical protein